MCAVPFSSTSLLSCTILILLTCLPPPFPLRSTASLADPIPALACARVFKDYSCWTRHMTVDFQRGGSSDLELRFSFPQELEQSIKEELAERGRATPTFECKPRLLLGRWGTKGGGGVRSETEPRPLSNFTSSVSCLHTLRSMSLQMASTCRTALYVPK